MKFLVDNQLPLALAQRLRQLGHEARHVIDLHLDEAEDLDIWQQAASLGWTIITKDEDFSRLVLLRAEPVQVVWVRLGNCRKAVLLDTVERHWPMVQDRLSAGDRLVEIY